MLKSFFACGSKEGTVSFFHFCGVAAKMKE
jgi:hypothetical protein